MIFTLDTEALTALAENRKAGPDLSGINFGMLDMLEAWAEREWQKKQNGQPSEWDQGTWFTKLGEEETGTACGSACCLAGKTVQVTPGVQWAEYNYTLSYSSPEVTTLNPTELDYGRQLSDAIIPVDMVSGSEDLPKTTIGGREYYRTSASYAAQIVLGLNSNEASRLFAGDNDLARVKEILAKIRNGDYRSRNSYSVTVPIVTTDSCNVSAHSVVQSLLGSDYESKLSLHRVYGRCVAPKGHAEGEHVFLD